MAPPSDGALTKKRQDSLKNDRFFMRERIHDQKMKHFSIFFLISLVLLLSPNFFLEARKRIDLDKIQYLRLGANIYRDSTAQRGFTTRLDYVSNEWLKTVYLGCIFDYDAGIKYAEPDTSLSAGTEYNNSRQDIGAVFGVNMISNIKSRFYMGTGLGWSNYTFSDSSKEEKYKYNSLFFSYHLGAEVRFKNSKNFVFIEYYIKTLPHRGDNQFAYEDKAELQRANITRWIIGLGVPL